MGIVELLLTTVVPALVPAAVDGVKGAINHFAGGAQAKPGNFQEWLEYIKAMTERAKVLAELDKPASNISQWVADLRASARYIMGFFIIASWVVLRTLEGTGHLAVGSSAEAGDLARMVFAFLYGDRMWHKIKSGS